MPTNVPLLPALLVALFSGALATVYLWRLHRKRLEAQAGIRALAAMRWREFSQFVINALQAQGFDAHALSEDGSARDPSDLLLTRDNRSWLLSCRQSAEFVITARQLQEMSDAVRKRSAAGGVIATLGRIDSSARRPPQGIEVLDGQTLWPLIGPLLPQGLQEHVAEQSRAGARRLTVFAWIGAALVGLAVALALSAIQATFAERPADPARAAQPSAAVRPQPASEPTPRAPVLGEEQQRQQVIDAVEQIPRVESASWASRSTLLISAAPGDDDLRPRICAVLESFEALRASRVQLQAASGGADAVRFFHCRLY